MTYRTNTIGCLAFYLHDCRAIPSARGAQEAVALLRDQGATFSQGGKEVTSVKPLPDEDALTPEGPDPAFVLEPGAVVGEDGGICGLLQLHHNLLVPDGFTMSAARAGITSEHAFGSFSFDAKFHGIGVLQNAENLEAGMIATGLLALALRLYRLLKPQYGWVDESGWNLPQGKSLAAPRPKYLFWANFFGPDRVASVGREFFEGIPSGDIVDLNDGGLLYVATENYVDWWQNDQSELLAYFRRQFPSIDIYRAQPMPC